MGCGLLQLKAGQSLTRHNRSLTSKCMQTPTTATDATKLLCLKNALRPGPPPPLPQPSAPTAPCRLHRSGNPSQPEVVRLACLLLVCACPPKTSAQLAAPTNYLAQLLFLHEYFLSRQRMGCVRVGKMFKSKNRQIATIALSHNEHKQKTPDRSIRHRP
jgi:hypothetical protein